jgi:cysteine desulfurase
MLYFDHNATTPLLPEARRTWLEAVDLYIGNPSSPHRLGSRADAALERARERLAELLHCDPADIVWTSGATESNNMVLHHFARVLNSSAGIWISGVEHPCVLNAARRFFAERYRLIPVTSGGIVDLQWLEKQLHRQRPGLVAIMAANNETGVVQPWSEALTLCRKRDVTFLCDAAQWIGKLPMHALGSCDFVSGCAHKFGGPKGVGFVKCPSHGRVHPLLVGGKQEGGRRAGTENVPGVLAMMAALEVRHVMLSSARPGSTQASVSATTPSPKAVAARLAWRSHFEDRLLVALPGSEIIGRSLDRLWNTVSALMPPTHCRQRWVVKLDKAGFAVSTGSACASGREEPSHVLAAMGYSPDHASRVLRLSSGWETSEAEWTRLLQALETVWRELRPKRSRSGNTS